jgi:palmitoyltransferase
MVKSRSRSLTYGEDNDHPLCLCEYYNRNNERVHMLMCCCNCEAFDSLCTSLICCKSNDAANKNHLFTESLIDILDRVRYPYFGGAQKLNWDFVLSLVSIFLYQLFGTINYICSILTIFTVPTLLYLRFFFVRLKQSRNNISSIMSPSSTLILKELSTQSKNKSKDSNRIQIAYYIVLNTLTYLIYLFNFKLVYELESVISASERILFNINLVTLIILHIYLHLSNPGFIEKTYSYGKKSNTAAIDEKSVALNPQQLYNYLDGNHCEKCGIKRDKAHIGHCSMCGSCVLNRDHHCFWIDNCIGYLNHKCFLSYLIFLLFFLVYSFCVIFKRFNLVNCKFAIFYNSKMNELNCLNDVYYENEGMSMLSLIFIQLIPLIFYLILLIVQQVFFISIGKTQQQLYKLSQKNYKFSIFEYACSRFSLKFVLKNWLLFLKLRNKFDIINKDNIIENDHFI